MWNSNDHVYSVAINVLIVAVVLTGMSIMNDLLYPDIGIFPLNESEPYAQKPMVQIFKIPF